MKRDRRARVAASGVVLLALVGLFIGHTLEYLRVWGSAGVIGSMTNPVHAYMLPVAGVLVVLSAILALRLARAWQALNDRLDRAAAGVRRMWRGRSDGVTVESAPRSSPVARLAAVWMPLAAAQIVLYVIQENVEALARGQAAPGWGAISGIHWAAPFVHLYVALLLACGVRICQILFRGREAVVERVESLLRAIVQRHQHTAAGTALPATQSISPLDLIGRHLWRRPPPQLLDT